MQFSTRFFAIAFVTFTLFGTLDLLAQDELGSSDATSAVDRYLQMLSDSRFQQRELATRELIEIGESAIPQIVAAVTESEDREVITRAFTVLRELANGPSIDVVTDSLQPLIDDSTTRRSVRRLTRQLFATVEDIIARRLQVLGAKISRDKHRLIVRIDLDEDWVGGDVDLRDLKRLRHVKTIDCEKSTISDETVPYLAKVPNLDKLYLGNCKVKGDGLKSLEGHTKIRYLSLIHQSLNESAYDSLAKMHSLTHLGLDETNTTDAQLAKLDGLAGLETLWLTNSNVTDAGLEVIAGFKSLTRIVLAGTKVEGAGLRHLRSLPMLARVDLTRTSVDDEALAELVGLTELKELRLMGTQITDGSLKTILSFENLTGLYLDRDVLLAEDVAALEEAMRKCRLELSKVPNRAKSPAKSRVRRRGA